MKGVHIQDRGGGEGVLEAPPEKSTYLKLKVCERVGKSVIFV